MRVVLMEFVSLDGVAQGPGAPDEDTTDGFTRGGWMVPHMDDAFLAMVREWVAAADAYLFGRRTYEAFAEAWPAMPDPDDPVARSLNGLHKYVASRTLTATAWGPATILAGDVPEQVRELRERPGRELQIHGSARLGWSLLRAGVVDELRLVISPTVVGAGRRLFGPTDEAIGLRPTSAVLTPGGLAVHTYDVEGPARVDTYRPAPSPAA